MNSPQPASDPAARGPAAQGRNWTRRLVNVLVALVVIAVAGATFIFSYSGVHAIALLGGVSAQLARYYPGLFDAVLVIASVTAVMLHGKQWWARLWAWLVIIIVLGAIGTADVLHAMNYTLRHRPTEGIVAAAPVVAVLLAFSLLLTLLRQSRTQAPSAPAAASLDVPALPAAVSAPPIALPAAPAVPVAAPATGADEPTVPVPVPLMAVEAAPPTQPVPLPEDSLVDAEVPEWEEPVPEDAVPADSMLAGPVPAGPVPAGTVPAGTVPEDVPPAEALAHEAHAPNGPDEIIPWSTPAVAAETVPDEPAPPTVEVTAVTLSPVPRSQGIRYAGSSARNTPRANYWETEDTEQFAGLVYRAREADDADGEEGNDAPANRPGTRQNPPEPDDDAPPFATAPFAPVPRLNRLRSMPTPPEDEDEDE
jgi:Protein of unknown function (DUF2637)